MSEPRAAVRGLAVRRAARLTAYRNHVLYGSRHTAAGGADPRSQPFVPGQLYWRGSPGEVSRDTHPAHRDACDLSLEV